jgi:hypothetical protein
MNNKIVKWVVCRGLYQAYPSQMLASSLVLNSKHLLATIVLGVRLFAAASAKTSRPHMRMQDQQRERGRLGHHSAAGGTVCGRAQRLRGRCWTDAAAKTKKCFAAPHSRAAANSLRCTSKGAYFFYQKT